MLCARRPHSGWACCGRCLHSGEQRSVLETKVHPRRQGSLPAPCVPVPLLPPQCGGSASVPVCEVGLGGGPGVVLLLARSVGPAACTRVLAGSRNSRQMQGDRGGGRVSDQAGHRPLQKGI